jgi:REP element-mobilizing transposase RayT
MKRTKLEGVPAVYHAMSRVVGGQFLLGDREKEVLRKMLWQVADFCGVEILTYCILSNHFHVLVRVPERSRLSDAELLRRFRVLYPKPTKYQTVEFARLEQSLLADDAGAEVIREQLLARMSDLSEFMKTLKQRFSIWYNRHHDRYGTLWMERFKSVLVEGQGNPLQTMAAYIDLNAVRAGLVEDPKDYRFCGYGEAVAGQTLAQGGLLAIWGERIGAALGNRESVHLALQAHRMLIFGKGSSPWLHRGHVISRERAVQVMEEEDGELSKAVMLHCRVRYFSDGAIFGTAEFVRGFADGWNRDHRRKYPQRVTELRGSDWGDLAVIQGLRRRVFS